MGVLSKALRTSVSVALVAAVGGCAFNRTAGGDSEQVMEVPGTSTVPGAEQAALPADQTISSVTTDPAASPIAEPTLTEQQLLSQGDIGFGVSSARGEGLSKYVLDLASGGSGDNEPVFDVKMVDNPSRLVVDVIGHKATTSKEVSLTDDPFLKSIRIGVHKDRTRVVFDVREGLAANEYEHQVDAENGRLMVSFLSPDAATTASAPKAPIDGQIVQAGSLDAALPEPIGDLAATTTDAANADVAAEVAAADAAAAASVDGAANVPAESLPSETITATALPSETAVTDVRFEKTGYDAGQVFVEMNGRAPFDLNRTAPSEYVLTIGGASVKDMPPMIAPKAFPGIRSARAVQTGESVAVRMFIDPNVELRAIPTDKGVMIKAEASQVATNPAARAQLEFGDQPQAAAKPADAPPAPVAADASNLRSADGSKIYTGRLISLDLQDTDIDNALRIIAEVSNLNIIASDDVTGKVTLRLIDVPWDQALDVILKTNGLDQVTEGNVIRIAPVDKLRQEREALKEAKKAAEQLEDLTVNYIRVSYAKVGDLKEQVESVLSERGTVATDERTNQLIVKDIKKGHVEAEALLKKLDLRTPQVLLETQIVEGARDILRDLGFQWNFAYAQSPETGNATGVNFPNSIVIGGSATDDDAVNFPAAIGDAGGSAVTAVLESADGSRGLSFRLSALETEGKVRIISRPQVATVNSKQAEIKSVETVRIRLPDSGTSIATGAGAQAAGGGASAFEEINVGITLRVTPQASPDYYVLLDINAQSSTFGSREVDGIPSTIDRNATSTILVKSGQTFALGGVYRLTDRDSVSGVPWLKDIPFLGYLFRRQLLNKADEELIFFITPHIVEGSFDPSLM